MFKQKVLAIVTAALLALSLAGCGSQATLGDIVDGASGFLDGAIQDAADAWNEGSSQNSGETTSAISLDDIPEFSGSPYVTVNDNVPYFTEEELTTEAFEIYS